MTSLAVAALLVVGAWGLLASVWFLRAVGRERRHGSLRSVDAGAPRAPIVAASLGLVGRPDELRELADGRPVPIELKSRSGPRSGPLASHRVQVEAYCLLVEAATGRSPPYGVLRYGDGTEWEIPWDAAARARTTARLRAVRRPYDGAATPSPAKCRGCGYRGRCDARAD